MTIYELKPTNGQKSFYGKANVYLNDDGQKILLSYGRRIMTIYPDGCMTRQWNGWTATTGKHIKAFSGLNKKEFLALEFCL